MNIFNFGTDPSDPLFLTGTTIYYTGKVRTSHDINDKHINGKPIIYIIRYLINILNNIQIKRNIITYIKVKLNIYFVLT